MLIIEYIYFLSLLLILTPPVILLNQFISTHVLAKIILFFLFMYVVFLHKTTRKVFEKYKIITFLFLLFFIFQSVSVIKAINLLNFFNNYQNILFTSFLFFLTVIIINKKNMQMMINILLASFVINIFFQLFIYFFPNEFVNYCSSVIHKEYMDIIEYNIQRGRVFFNSYGEILVPIFFYLIIKNKNIYFNLILFCFIFIQLFISFVTNFRTNLLMYIFAFISVVVLYRKIINKHIFFVLFIFLICLYLFNKIQFSLNNVTVFERINEESIFSKQSTVVGRIKNWQSAFDMGMSSFIFGVGLGNYYDHISSILKSQPAFQQIEKKGNYLAQQDPHNIFFSALAESGVLGLFSLLLLVFYFIKKDVFILKSNNLFRESWVISFWTLFIFAIFNPTITINYQTLFWIIRIIVEKS
jgi:hypothetical protein